MQMGKKKSRSGCFRCKARHIKCDEVHPTCGACQRYLHVCIYPETAAAHPVYDRPPPRAQASLVSTVGPLKHSHAGVRSARHRSETRANITSPSHNAATFVAGKGARHDGASVNELDSLLNMDVHYRRRCELKLLHNYLTNMTNRTAHRGQLDTEGIFEWGLEIPKMAMHDDGILNGLLAHSALHLQLQSDEQTSLAEGEPYEETLQILPQKYFGLALQLHRRAVNNLTQKTAERVCFGGIIINMHLFARVQTLETNPWEPPLDWLCTGRGVGRLLWMAQTQLDVSRSSDCMSRFLKTNPFCDSDEMFTQANRAGLLWLIDSSDVQGPPTCMGESSNEDQELQDPATESVYHRVLSYIGHVRKITERGESVRCIKRALAAFSIWTPESFQVFLRERRSRALVVLAYFFAMWTKLEPCWFVGHAGRVQVHAIHHVLRGGWEHKVSRIALEFAI